MSKTQRTGNPLEREVRYVKGVGPKRAAVLDRLGIKTVRDLLLHLARDYEDRRYPRPIAGLRVGEKAVISGTIQSVNLRPTRGRMKGILDVVVTDRTGSLSLTWFNANIGWRKSFPIGEAITAYGAVSFYSGLQMVAPDCQVGDAEPEKFGRILPVYPLTEGISQGVLCKLMLAALELAATGMPEILPRTLCHEKHFPDITQALHDVHFPRSMQDMAAARRRLCYEELFVFQTALALRRASLQQTQGIAFRVGPNVDRRIRRLFPFSFTSAQDRVIEEVAADMRSARPMNRLLQGDVGSGKTVVAVYAMLAALAESSRGYQAALMAPTEILAEQHFLTLGSLLEKARIRTALLTSAASSQERRRNLDLLAGGELDLVVGTHALIQRDVRFRNLGLVVVDEQHRFGVRQRLALREKGPPPDVLIMTATPIPRTLAMAYFADMDVSIIDEMPPGRSAIRTELYLPTDWDKAFDAAREELAAGRGVFVVYPLVEENRELDLTSAKEGFEQLSRRVFPDHSCCLLHGQMPQRTKQEAMEGFRAGRHQVMAATTVVEVGIDVPQATVMIVQHAERLGLAQLHQLRGRIGRGQHPGRCFLLADPKTEEARQRLDVLTQTNDGFRIAEEDLRIRGPGQLFGTQQSGMPEFRCYDFSAGLAQPQHRLLRKKVLEEYGRSLALADVG
ncbi:MAG: ATP-dependent DNA helicase RecG [Planctomycetota bacterium]|jgi:ATP-dependent DNA helicase RecG